MPGTLQLEFYLLHWCIVQAGGVSSKCKRKNILKIVYHCLAFDVPIQHFWPQVVVLLLVNETLVNLNIQRSLTIGSACAVLPSHHYHFYTKKSAANARTTNCKSPF